MNQIRLPNAVEHIINTLESAGFEAYAVGGCVRDSIMGRIPHDWDICTSANPDEMFDIFKNEKIIPTGLQHGTITVLIDNVGYEITTYRIEKDYSDHRRPDSVEFTTILAQDLMRRDFTINALAYNNTTGIVDLFDGLKDIHSRKICTVNSAEERFNEDALRILRAIRFSSQLDFEIDYSVAYQIHQDKYLLDFISKERIQSEFVKIVQSSTLSVQLDLFKDVFAQFIPEIKDMFEFPQNNPYHAYDVWNHTLHAVANAEDKDLITKLAVLFHDIGKPHSYQDGDDGIRHFHGHGRVSAEITDQILRNLKFDNFTRESVVQLISYHDATFEVGTKYVRRWINKIGEEQFIRLLDLREADIKGQSDLNLAERLEKIERIRDCYNQVRPEPVSCFTVKDLAVNGDDLISLGYKPGKTLGSILNLMLERVLSEELDNTKEILIDFAKSLYVPE